MVEAMCRPTVREEKREALARGVVGEAGGGVFGGGGAEGDGGVPHLVEQVEQVEQGGQDAGLSDVRGALADRDQGLAEVDDDPLRDGGRGPHLAAPAAQPVGVGDGVRLVASGVLVKRAHGDAAGEDPGAGGAGGVEVLGALVAGLDADDLAGGFAAHAFQAVQDGVHAEQSLPVLGAALGPVGDHAGDGGAGGGQGGLAFDEFGFMAGQQV
ncbi:hypothetical protein [Streptomyces sp. TLI_171]|uniref:hypothetical protein n=1 Tax=Streptomyces sp. TLI_171 TaxID=1938859 RepID=UPI0011803EF2|nr:hypothetical protein [Streptomyces sp. TLI_171]